MSKEHPTLRGTISGVEQNGAYGFVNDAQAINGYAGDIPSSIFVHAKMIKGQGQLREGMCVIFDAVPSSRQQHSGKMEGANVQVCRPD